MAPSTRTPIEIAIPASDIMLDVNFKPNIGINDRSTATGMVKIGTLADGKCHKKKMITSRNNLAVVKRNLGEMNEAMDLFKGSLELAENINDQQGISGSLQGQGEIFFDLGFVLLQLKLKIRDPSLR